MERTIGIRQHIKFFRQSADNCDIMNNRIV